MNAILPPALANAALLLAAPSLGCIDEYIEALTNLCRAYKIPVPDFKHVLQCKQQTNVCQKINLGNMVNILDLNVIHNDIKMESEDYDSVNNLQEIACKVCYETHPVTDFVCPIKKELTEEYTAMYLTCRDAAETKTQASPLRELPITKTKESFSQDQAQQSNKDTLQKVPVTFEAHANIKSFNEQATKIKHIATNNTELGNIVTGVSLTSSYSSKLQQKKPLCQIFDRSSNLIDMGENQKHSGDLIIDKSYKSQSSDKENQRHNLMNNCNSTTSTNEKPQIFLAHNVFDDTNLENNDKGSHRTPNPNVFDIKDLLSYDGECKENYVKDILDKSIKNQMIPAKNNGFKHSQLTIVNPSNSIANRSKSESKDLDHEKYPNQNISDSKAQSHNKENEKFPQHNNIDKRAHHEEEQQKLSMHNVLDKSKSQCNNGKHQKLPMHNTFEKSKYKSKDIESNSNKEFQSVNKEESKSTEKDTSKFSRKAKIQITVKDFDRPPVYHILDNNGKVQLFYSKEKAKKMLNHSLSVQYSNVIRNPSKCTMYVSTIRNGSTRIPWLHLEFIKTGGHKAEKHIPFSKISEIALWKNNSIRIYYTQSRSEIVKSRCICLQVTKHKNNKKETAVASNLSLLKWLHTFYR